jgi:glycosyltransferase involved in cell wall biosynthesis
MKILYLSQFYYPENIAAAFRAFDNANNWRRSDADVTVLTTYPNYPLGRVFPGYDGRNVLQEEDIDGVRVLRSRISIKNNKNIINRVINALSFKRYAIANIRKNRDRIGTDYDVVVATSGPIFAAQVGQYFSKKFNIPLVFEIRDVSFEQLKATGSREDSWKVKIMKRWELDLCGSADKIVVLTKGFKKILVEKGVEGDKIAVIPNGVDVSDAHVRKEKFYANRAYEDTALTIGYFGTIGISQDIDTVLDYLDVLNNVMGLRFLIVGAGAQDNHIKELVNKRYPFVSMEGQKASSELEPVYEQCDLCVVSLKKSESFSATLPSKLFQIMGRGIPVLFIGPEGEASTLVSSHGAGIALIESRDKDIEQLTTFFTSPDWRKQLENMGARGRSLVEKQFSRKELSKEFLEILEKIKREGTEND